jgi:hypothetical protein
MQVSDLYMILHELQQVATLQSNLAALFSTNSRMSGVYTMQQQAEAELKKIMDEYERYTL